MFNVFFFVSPLIWSSAINSFDSIFFFCLFNMLRTVQSTVQSIRPFQLMLGFTRKQDPASLGKQRQREILRSDGSENYTGNRWPHVSKKINNFTTSLKSMLPNVFLLSYEKCTFYPKTSDDSWLLRRKTISSEKGLFRVYVTCRANMDML